MQNEIIDILNALDQQEVENDQRRAPQQQDPSLFYQDVFWDRLIHDKGKKILFFSQILDYQYNDWQVICLEAKNDSLFDCVFRRDAFQSLDNPLNTHLYAKIINRGEQFDEKTGFVVVTNQKTGYVFLKNLHLRGKYVISRAMISLKPLMIVQDNLRVRDFNDKVTLSRKKKTQSLLYNLRGNEFISIVRELGRTDPGIDMDRFLYFYPIQNRREQIDYSEEAQIQGSGVYESEKQNIENDIDDIMRIADHYGDIFDLKKIKNYFQTQYIWGFRFYQQMDVKTALKTRIARFKRSQILHDIENEQLFQRHKKKYINKFSDQNRTIQRFEFVRPEIQTIEDPIINITPLIVNLNENFEHVHLDASWVNGQQIVGVQTFYNDKKMFLGAYLVGAEMVNIKNEYQSVYKRIIQDLREKFNISQVTGDFSRQLRSAVGSFPNMKFWGCQFHYKQAINAKAKKFDIKENNRSLWIYATCLPYIKRKPLTQRLQNVLLRVENFLLRHNREDDQNFMAYLNRTYFTNGMNWFQNIIASNYEGRFRFFRLTNSPLERKFEEIKRNVGMDDIPRSRLIQLIAFVVENDFNKPPLNEQSVSLRTRYFYQFAYQELDEFIGLLNINRQEFENFNQIVYINVQTSLKQIVFYDQQII